MQNSTEEELKLVAEDIFADPPPVASTPRSRRKNGGDFVFLRGVTGLNAYLVQKRAEAVYPLLLALQQHFDLSRKARVPLTRDVWKMAGDPARHKRETVVAHLRRMPELVTLYEDYRTQFRYRVEKGLLWRHLEEASREGIGPKSGEEKEG
jgi:hypothetical protein